MTGHYTFKASITALTVIDTYGNGARRCWRWVMRERHYSGIERKCEYPTNCAMYHFHEITPRDHVSIAFLFRRIHPEQVTSATVFPVDTLDIAVDWP